MSTLIVDELYDGVTFEQEFKIQRDTNLAHIRPWVYKHGTLQDGDFQCQVLEGATVLATATINYATINAEFTDNYAHGFIRFDFDSLALHVPEGSAEGTYKLQFSMQSHTTDTNNFLGIVRRWEDKTYETYGTGVSGGEAQNDMIEPAGLELFEYKNN